MTSNEYINLYHSTDAVTFFNKITPTLFNAFWTSNGESYYPCIVLDDHATANSLFIITRNQTFMHHPRSCIKMMNEY
jgi:hypothetical protein